MKTNVWYFLFTLTCFSSLSAFAGELAITIDDPRVDESPLLSAAERDKRLREALDRHGHLKAALFVCGKRVGSLAGEKLLQNWSNQKHLIGNHSYSHKRYDSPSNNFDAFSADILAGEKVIKGLSSFQRIFRFPLLREGDTVEKRDKMRAFLRQHDYRTGYVSIDTADWYIAERLEARLEAKPNADLEPYRKYYLSHIWGRAEAYNNLALKVLGRQPKHTLLIHHTLLNALFLDDILKMFEKKGWKLVSADEAYRDPMFELQPNILPAGESILWALGKEQNKLSSDPRPAEDAAYIKNEMDNLNL